MNGQDHQTNWELVIFFIAVILFVYALPFIVFAYLWRFVPTENRLACIRDIVIAYGCAIGYGFWVKSGSLYSGNVEGILIGFALVTWGSCIIHGWRNMLGLPPKAVPVVETVNPNILDFDDNSEFNDFDNFNFDNAEFELNQQDDLFKKRFTKMIDSNRKLHLNSPAYRDAIGEVKRLKAEFLNEREEAKRKKDRFNQLMKGDISVPAIYNECKKAGDEAEVAMKNAMYTLAKRDMALEYANSLLAEIEHQQSNSNIPENSASSQKEAPQGNVHSTKAQEDFASEFDRDVSVSSQMSFMRSFDADSAQPVVTQGIVRHPDDKKWWARHDDKASTPDEKRIALNRIKLNVEKRQSKERVE